MIPRPCSDHPPWSANRPLLVDDPAALLAVTSSRGGVLNGRRRDDVDVIREAPRFELVRWPTPVQELEEGLWVKRDDLSGFGRGGAKARKIEHVLGHMRASGFDELITVAGNVTNLAFDILPALARSDIRPRLLIIDDPPVSRSVREEIFAGVLADVRLLGPSRVGALLAALGALRDGRGAGRNPFLLLPGACHPSAVLGNAVGFVEMVENFSARGRRPPDTVFVTVATGNTVAGFLVGEQALRSRGHPPIRIVGVQAYPGRARWWTLGLVRWTERYAGLRGRVPSGRIVVDASALQGGFGRFTGRLAAECERIEADHGLSIDPIFGGKTWHVMQAWRERGDVGGSALFWHCGYTPEWRAIGESVRAGAGA